MRERILKRKAGTRFLRTASETSGVIRFEFVEFSKGMPPYVAHPCEIDEYIIPG